MIRFPQWCGGLTPLPMPFMLRWHTSTMNGKGTSKKPWHLSSQNKLTFIRRWGIGFTNIFFLSLFLLLIILFSRGCVDFNSQSIYSLQSRSNCQLERLTQVASNGMIRKLRNRVACLCFAVFFLATPISCYQDQVDTLLVLVLLPIWSPKNLQASAANQFTWVF